MSVLGLNHYNLRADRELMELLKAFYCDVIGLAPGPRPPFDSFGYWLYAGDRPVLHLSEAGAGESCATHAVTTFDHVAFDCADRPSVQTRLEAQGISFRTAHVPLTRQTQLFLRDPAGNGVELNFTEP